MVEDSYYRRFWKPLREMDSSLSVLGFPADLAISLRFNPSTNGATDHGAIVGDKNPACHFLKGERCT